MSSHYNNILLLLLFAQVRFFIRGSRIFLKIFRIPNNGEGLNPLYYIILLLYNLYCHPVSHNHSTRPNNIDSDYNICTISVAWAHGKRDVLFSQHGVCSTLCIQYIFYDSFNMINNVVEWREKKKRSQKVYKYTHTHTITRIRHISVLLTPASETTRR